MKKKISYSKQEKNIFSYSKQKNIISKSLPIVNKKIFLNENIFSYSKQKKINIFL